MQVNQWQREGFQSEERKSKESTKMKMSIASEE
jgi:hypothetical protein